MPATFRVAANLILLNLVWLLLVKLFSLVEELLQLIGSNLQNFLGQVEVGLDIIR